MIDRLMASMMDSPDLALNQFYKTKRSREAKTLTTDEEDESGADEDDASEDDVDGFLRSGLAGFRYPIQI